MDANSKVQRYLDDLRRDARPAADTLRSVRGPGQKTTNPLQFVATKTGEDMAERAKQIVTATEQQKVERHKELKNNEYPVTRQAVEDDWQADLDTWRRKRKTKLESSVPETKPPSYGSSVDYGIRKEKEEILTIRSPDNDSGIENRTLSHSPSTSIDFSPRSAELISPKSLEAISPPAYAPPPPPPPLDQVLIPLSTPSIPTTTSTNAPRTSSTDDDYPPPPTHLRSSRSVSSELLSPSRARVSASFPASERQHQRLEPFVAQSIREQSAGEKTVNAELTVELNREQKAHVQATKYPGREPRAVGARGAEAAALRSAYTPRSMDDKHSSNNNPSFVSTVRYSFEPTAQPASRSSSTPNVSAQKPVYRAVDIPFDDSAASYQPPKRDKDGLMTIVVEMGGQPVHKGFGFSVACERRRCYVDSVIVGTPADRQGLLIGDRIESINGETVADKYPSAINRLLHEAARNGEVVLRVERTHTKSSFGSTPNLAAPMGNRFDQARSVFSEKQNDSYAEFKRKHSRAAREKPSPREYNSLPRSSSTGFISKEYGRSDYSSATDYRVSSLHDRTKPGKLDDFVPEVDRRREIGASIVGPRSSFEETRTIRNYELIGSNSAPAVREDRSVSSPLRQKTSDEDDDTVPGKAYLESRDWRDVINQQRQAAPGMNADTRRIQQATSSLSNLPDIMDKKLEEQRRLVNEQTDYRHTRAAERREPREVYERSEYSFYEKTYTPAPFETARNTSSSTTVKETERRFPSSDYVPRETSLRREEQIQEAPLTQHVYRETREPPREAPREIPREVPRETIPVASPPPKETRETPKEAITREPENRDSVVAVSGKHRCAHCGEELGRGAAMIVESLNLYYHLACFKCYVCKTPLGSGTTGADVRVREGRLHCQSCYSSDRVQLSKV